MHKGTFLKYQFNELLSTTINSVRNNVQSPSSASTKKVRKVNVH